MGESKLKFTSFEKQYDDVINIVYYDLFVREKKKTDKAKYDAEESDFLRLKELLLMLIGTSNDIFPLVFNPDINARFEVYIRRSEQYYKVEAKFYQDNYKDYDSLIWDMNKNGLQEVIDQIAEIF